MNETPFYPLTSQRSIDGRNRPAGISRDLTAPWPWLTEAAAFLAVGIGALVLAGWAFDNAVLKSVVPGLRVMVPNTALAFGLTGIALALQQGRGGSQGWRFGIAAILSSAVLVLGGTTLVEHLTGLRFNVESWFFQNDGGQDLHAGRLSPQAAINFVLVSIALLLMRSRRKHAGVIADTCALAVLIVSWLALANYSYDVTRLYNVPRYPGLALHTVLGFCVLSIGLLFSNRNMLVGRVMNGGAAGALLRRFLPAALLIPLVLGWMRLAGEDAGWYDDPLGLALLSLAFTAVLIVLVWASAATVARMEFRREQAERALLDAYDSLEGQVGQRTAELGKVNDSLRYEIGRREEVEASLRASERWFQDLFERAPDPMCSFDAFSGAILECNQTMADVLGYSKNDLIGRPILDLCEADSAAEAAALLGAFMRREPIRDEDLRLRRHDGTPLDVSLSMSAVLDDRGEIVRVRSVWRDITSRKMAQEELADLLSREQTARQQAEEADRLKDEFLASVSHELRAPLNPILGWVHVLRQSGIERGVFDRALAAIERSARVQKQLVEDLLDASRITTGKLKLVMSRVDVASIVEAAVDATLATAEAKAISVVTTREPDAGAVLGDPERLHQVVWNLVGNAIKFTPNGGEVSVWVRRANGSVEIGVSDTGPGIAPDFLPFLFDRFRQADGSTTRRHGGLGLGLAIVRHLVELHGGDVHAENARVGRGATFVVRLPSLAAARVEELARPSPHHGAEPPQAGEPAARTIAAAHVLVIDDDPDARDLLVALLTSHGARAEAVARASDALTRLVEQDGRAPFDVVVCDVGMPDEDGYSFIRRVRALHDPRVSHIPAIALTGYARYDDRARAMAAGFQIHLTKPVEATELVRALGTLTHGASGSMPLHPPSA